MKLNKDDIYGIVGSVAFHLFILLILGFTVLKTVVPDEDGGILVNFGNVNAAAGTFEPKYTGQEDALEESVLTLLQDYDMVDECIIGSMNKGILQKMKELEPGISTVFIAHDLEEEDYELDYADSYSIEGRNLTVDMVDAIHYCGKSVYGWTANTSGAMLRIVNCGADGVITDDVRLLQTFLREQACRKAFASVY